MQPASSRDFSKAARQRLDVSREIYDTLRRNLEAKYLAGYAVECSLKALILHRTAPSEFEEKLKKITKGASWHNFEVLKDELKGMGVVMPLEIVKKIRRMNSDWSPALRYETGRLDSGETKAFINSAETVHLWTMGEMI